MNSLIRKSDPISGRLYAIGDIHGCAQELSHLLKFLESEEKVGRDDTVVFLGDFIDRGPYSKEILDLILQWSPCNCVYLKGNHEDMMLDFLGLHGRHGAAWIQGGGDETLKSYGVDVSMHPDTIIGAIPDSHIKFMQSLEPGVLFEPWLFVHAGIHPLRELENQREKDLLWIRDEFVMNVHKLPYTVVFGHTPFEDVLVNLPYKIGLDTGLVYGHQLSCMEFTKGQLFQISQGENKVRRKEIQLDRGDS